MKVLETDRLTLRHVSLDDAPFLLELMNDPSYLRFIGDRGIRTVDEARRYTLEKFIESYERNGFGLFLIERREDGASLGICGLIKRPSLEDVDIGFALRPAFWSKGYTFEAASAVMDHSRNMLEIKRIVAITSQDNEASIGALRKLGFRFERLIKLAGGEEELTFYVSEG